MPALLNNGKRSHLAKLRRQRRQVKRQLPPPTPPAPNTVAAHWLAFVADALRGSDAQVLEASGDLYYEAAGVVATLIAGGYSPQAVLDECRQYRDSFYAPGYNGQHRLLNEAGQAHVDPDGVLYIGAAFCTCPRCLQRVADRSGITPSTAARYNQQGVAQGTMVYHQPDPALVPPGHAGGTFIEVLGPKPGGYKQARELQRLALAAASK